MHSTGKQEIKISDFKMGRPNWEQPNISSWEVIASWAVTYFKLAQEKVWLSELTVSP